MTEEEQNTPAEAIEDNSDVPDTQSKDVAVEDAASSGPQPQEEEEQVKDSLPPSIKIDIPTNGVNATAEHSNTQSESVVASSAASTLSPDDDIANENNTVSPTRTGRLSRRSRSIALSVSSVTTAGHPIISSAVFIRKL